MIDSNNASSLIGGTVVDRDGDKIGTVGQLYIDPSTGQPKWVTVKTGLFGLSETFVPLEQASVDGDTIRVPYEKAFVKDAPRIDADGPLEYSDEQELYNYYGIGGGTAGTGAYATGTAGASYAEDRDAAGTADSTGYDTSGRETDDAMTRSEEQLNVGTERVETGRARLRKYVVTENESVTVPVTREEVRLEREPITDANVDAATSGPEISEDEHAVTLSEERPVVEKETVPQERVRLGTETVTDDETINEEVRKEQIDYVDETERSRR